MACMIAPTVFALAIRPLRRSPAPPLLPDREVTWSNPLGTALTEIADNVWLAERPFYPRLPGLQGTDVACKACIIRLPDGKLWVHAPVGLDDALRKTLATLGPVGHIVTPNTEHQKFAPLWFVEYPDATSYACPGLREKKPEVGWQRSLESFLDGRDGVAAKAPPAEWGGAIDLCWIRDQVPLSGLVGGVPFFNEIVFCHRPSRTLIVTCVRLGSSVRSSHHHTTVRFMESHVGAGTYRAAHSQALLSRVLATRARCAACAGTRCFARTLASLAPFQCCVFFAC